MAAIADARSLPRPRRSRICRTRMKMGLPSYAPIVCNYDRTASDDCRLEVSSARNEPAVQGLAHSPADVIGTRVKRMRQRSRCKQALMTAQRYGGLFVATLTAQASTQLSLRLSMEGTNVLD